MTKHFLAGWALLSTVVYFVSGDGVIVSVLVGAFAAACCLGFARTQR